MDEFSAAIAEELFADFPEWRIFAQELKADDGSQYLVVEVPSPKEADTPNGILITTNDTEITVSFDGYHSHFRHWRTTEPADYYRAAYVFVRSILNESVAIASCWNGERCLGASQVINGELFHMHFNFSRIRVRSWRGRHNKLSRTNGDLDADGSIRA